MRGGRGKKGEEAKEGEGWRRVLGMAGRKRKWKENWVEAGKERKRQLERYRDKRREGLQKASREKKKGNEGVSGEMGEVSGEERQCQDERRT